MAAAVAAIEVAASLGRFKLEAGQAGIQTGFQLPFGGHSPL
jgi:hypothetical protein